MYDVRNVYDSNFEGAFYSVTTSSGHLADDYPITAFSENKRFSNFFCNQTCEIQGST